MVYQLFDKKVSSSGNKSMPSQQLADELHKQILKKIFLKKYIHHLKAIFGVLILQICIW